MKLTYPSTPDGHYFVVKGKLWRTVDPSIPAKEQELLVRDLMSARRDVAIAKRNGDKVAEKEARQHVGTAKWALGERGPPWWTDGAPDYTRCLVKNTPYAEWFAGLNGEDADSKAG